MSNWGFLSSLLDKVGSHTTPIGQIWMSVLLLFRIMMLCGPAENAWSDDKSGFMCHSITPMFTPLCHDILFPISYINYWTMQLILVSTPTLLYLGHVMLVTHRENRLREKIANPQLPNPTERVRYTDEKGHVKIKGNLLCSYLIHLLAKIIIEAVSVWGEVMWLHGFTMNAEILCSGAPDSNGKTFDCYTARPIEKTYFIRYMLIIACFSVLLNFFEMVYILCKQKCCFRSCKQRNRSREEDPDSVQIHSLPMEDPDSMQTQRSLPSYNSHMSQNLQNQQLEDNNIIMEVVDGQGRSLSGSLDGDQGGETTTALVHQGRRSFLFP